MTRSGRQGAAPGRTEKETRRWAQSADRALRTRRRGGVVVAGGFVVAPAAAGVGVWTTSEGVFDALLAVSGVAVAAALIALVAGRAVSASTMRPRDRELLGRPARGLRTGVMAGCALGLVLLAVPAARVFVEADTSVTATIDSCVTVETGHGGQVRCRWTWSYRGQDYSALRDQGSGDAAGDVRRLWIESRDPARSFSEDDEGLLLTVLPAAGICVVLAAAFAVRWPAQARATTRTLRELAAAANR